MKWFLTFFGGFVAGVLVTIFMGFLLMKEDTPIEDSPANDGLIGLTLFPEKGDCLKNSSKMESTEIGIFQVIEPNMALAEIESFTLIGVTRYYDYGEEITALIINNDGTFEQEFTKENITKKNKGTWIKGKENCRIYFKNLKLFHQLPESNKKLFSQNGMHRSNNIVFVEDMGREFDFYRVK